MHLNLYLFKSKLSIKMNMTVVIMTKTSCSPKTSVVYFVFIVGIRYNLGQ